MSESVRLHQHARSFVTDWLRSRERETFFLGLPAAILVGALSTVFALSFTKSPVVMSAKYLSAGQQALAARELDTADLYYRKSLILQPNAKQTLIDSVRLADERGDATRRGALLARLMEEFAWPEAFLMRAQGLLRSPSLEESRLNEVNALLVEFSSLRQESGAELAMVVQRDLAAAYRKIGNLEKARTCLEDIGQPTPGDQLELASLAKQLGNTDGARKGAEAVLAEQGVGPGQAFRSLVSSAKAHAVLDDGRAAYEYFERASGLVKEADQRRLRAQAMLWCFEELYRGNPERPPLVFLERLLTEEPLYGGLAALIVRLAVPGIATEGSLSQGALEGALATGETLVTAHLLLGLRALGIVDGGSDSEGEALHFEMAQRLNPRSALTLCRCSLILAESDPARLPAAVSISRMGIAITGKHPYALEVHSLLLGAEGRWQEVVDLLTPVATNEHRSLLGLLAKGHSELGDDEMAESYQTRASASSEG